MAQILDGKALSQRVRAELASAVAAFTKQAHQPKLCVLRVGHDPASEVYVRNKAKQCVETGMASFVQHWPEASEAQVLAQIDEWNADPSVSGILVQLPLPKPIDEQRVLDRISADKDADGFHPLHTGRLALGLKAIAPCTPAGCMKLIFESETLRGKQDLSGLHAVVIGRSNIVGKPMAQLLLAKNATVTICHSRTQDLAAHVARADILVAAIGRAETIKGSWIKPGAIVIDVGINRVDGKLVGDVEFAPAAERAAAITPVPGGVGPMTIAMLLENTLACARAMAAAAAAIRTDAVRPTEKK